MSQVNAVQRTLVEAWGIVRETYVDPTFNNQGNISACAELSKIFQEETFSPHIF